MQEVSNKKTTALISSETLEAVAAAKRVSREAARVAVKHKRMVFFMLHYNDNIKTQWKANSIPSLYCGLTLARD